MKVQFKLPFDTCLSTYLTSTYPEVSEYRILSKALDARGAPRGKKPVYLYTLDMIKKGENFHSNPQELKSFESVRARPIFIGAGPAGLFGALRLAEQGIPSTIIERGDIAQRRMLAISRYWRHGVLNTENNVCFGEGGAGLFSDGKLITRIKSPYVKYVMNKFVEFGAPEEVSYITNPHLGSNKIRKIITIMTDRLKELGCRFIYNDSVTELVIDNNQVNEHNSGADKTKKERVIGVKLMSGESIYSPYTVLCAGHSAKDLYHHIIKQNVATTPKDFAVGVRIEHPRSYIDSIQHGRFANELETARYKLTHHNKKTDKGTYSFCMCPGGYVLSSGTESEGIVVNGMSNFARNSPWSNSALVVSIKNGVDFHADKDPLAGLKYQEEIEKKAYKLSKKYASGKELPALTLKEFLEDKISPKELPKTSAPSKLFKADLREIFDSSVIEHLKNGLMAFDTKMKGFNFDNALLIAPETRTSSPLTILRDKVTFESKSHSGLYPCGEGAGYAGGITSAAVDGIKVSETIIATLS